VCFVRLEKKNIYNKHTRSSSDCIILIVGVVGREYTRSIFLYFFSVAFFTLCGTNLLFMFVGPFFDVIDQTFIWG
jgi:hypothetical protein